MRKTRGPLASQKSFRINIRTEIGGAPCVSGTVRAQAARVSTRRCLKIEELAGELFPRSKDCGPIEACPAQAFAGCRPHFRGRKTAAPLKRRQIGLDDLAGGYFRGRKTAAPLKHHGLTRRVAVHVDFRGRKTAAPLKPQHAIGSVSRVYDFRGRKTAAPLKPDPLFARPARACRFPRSKDCGPIEAWLDKRN